jgi:hypothetical protein
MHVPRVQTITASYPILHFSSAPRVRLLWFFVFGCKFTKSYFFLAFAFRDPIWAMAGMKILNCYEKLFSDFLMLRHDAGLHVHPTSSAPFTSLSIGPSYFLDILHRLSIMQY